MPPPKPVTYRNLELRKFYEYSLGIYRKVRAQPLRKLVVIPVILPFYYSMLTFFAMAAGVVASRSAKFWAAMGIWFAVWLSLLAGVSFQAHYIAGGLGLAIVGAMYGVRLQRVYAKDFGKALVLLFVGVTFSVGLIFAGHAPDLERRRSVENGLIARGGRHLVMVRYDPGRPVQRPDWVFNAADIDASPVVWARDLGAAANRELFAYYRDRKVWLLEPDSSVQPRPYPAP